MFKKLLVVLPVLTFACAEIGGVDCDLAAYASVQVEVLDEAGAPIDDATVEFAVDGDDGFAACEFSMDGVYVCGWEVDGAFEIAITKDGFEPQTLEVTVGADECHVITEQRDVTLVAEVRAGG